MSKDLQTSTVNKTNLPQTVCPRNVKKLLVETEVDERSCYWNEKELVGSVRDGVPET